MVMAFKIGWLAKGIITSEVTKKIIIASLIILIKSIK